MQCANTLVERVQLFAERFTKVGELLDKTRKSFDELNTVTATSGQSITTAARNLLKYGAQENKKKKDAEKPQQQKQKKYVTAAEYKPPETKSADDVWKLVDKI